MREAILLVLCIPSFEFVGIHIIEMSGEGEQYRVGVCVVVRG